MPQAALIVMKLDIVVTSSVRCRAGGQQAGCFVYARLAE